MISVGWKSGLLKAGWKIDDQPAREYLFSRWQLRRMPRNARDKDLSKQFNALLSSTRLLSWWLETCGGAGHKLFLLKFREGGWDIPWEWLIGELEISDNRRKVSLVRSLIQQSPIFQPSKFEKPLQVLMLQGEDGTSINAKLDLTKEAAAIGNAWKGLTQSARARILEPIVLPARADTMVDLLDQYKPDLVWFGGHGQHKPEPGLLFSDGKWITPSKISKLLKSASWKPRFWLLMACDTARGGRTLAELPQFMTAFFEAGALGTIAMQSPIGDKSAHILAGELFGGLALGLSLELALARARNVLRSTVTEGKNVMDWAAPVIWSSTGLVEKWEWDATDQTTVQLQLLGTDFLRARLANPDQLTAISSGYEEDAARGWISSKRTWIANAGTDPEIRARWIRILQTVQRTSPHFVLEITCQDVGAERSLKQWAEAQYSTLLPGDAPDDFARALLLLKSEVVEGWKALLKVQGLFIAISTPPDFDESDWFWEPLLELHDGTKVAILSNQAFPISMSGVWAVDRIKETMTGAVITDAVARAPRLVRAMAVLREPIGYSFVRLADDVTSEPRSLNEWQDWKNLLLDFPGGPLMSATVRNTVLSSTTNGELRTAHIDCAYMLSNPEIRRTTRVREEVVFHAVQAGDWKPAADEATALIALYRELDRPRAAVELARIFGTHETDFGSRAGLPLAWAYAQVGLNEKAKFWLRRAKPVTALESAWKEGLRAELLKAEGDREGAAAAIDEAINICEEALRTDTMSREIARRLRNYRQDKARILHFLFYHLQEATRVYEELISSWKDQPEAELDVAIVRRNYSECLRALAEQPQDPRMLQARDQLDLAEQIAKKYEHAPLLAEIFYEQVKMAEAEHRDSDAHNYLLKCIKAARQTGHYLVLAIAEARFFWSEEPFSLERWREIETQLQVFPYHGWAVRTLINGQLKAAHQLELKGQEQRALDILGSAQQIIAKHPSFRGRSDRFRTAAVAAGQDVLSRRIGVASSAWADFKKLDWSEKYLIDQANQQPEAIWTKVV